MFSLSLSLSLSRSLTQSHHAPTTKKRAATTPSARAPVASSSARPQTSARERKVSRACFLSFSLFFPPRAAAAGEASNRGKNLPLPTPPPPSPLLFLSLFRLPKHPGDLDRGSGRGLEASDERREGGDIENGSSKRSRRSDASACDLFLPTVGHGPRLGLGLPARRQAPALCLCHEVRRGRRRDPP